MLCACWAAKGGSGTTVVAAALAVSLSRAHRGGVLLVDVAGDALAALGCGRPVEEAVEASRADDDADLEMLRARAVPVTPQLHVLPLAAPAVPSPARHDRLVSALAADSRPVVVDCGVLSPTAGEPLGEVLAASATHSLLVTRLCFLAVRRAVLAPVRPTGVVVVSEPGRALRPGDIEATVGAPVVAELPYDPAVARCVDAGLMATRLPRPLARSLRTLVP